MTAISRKPNRRSPSLPYVAQDLKGHTDLLTTIRNTLEIGQRRTADFKNSFVSVQDLIDLGIIDEDGNFVLEVSSSDDATSGVVETVAPGSGIDVDSTDPANPVVSVEAVTISGAAAGATAVQPARAINTGTGLNGGGNLSADRTLSLADTAVIPGVYTNPSITVDQQGRLTAAANGTSGSGTGGGLWDFVGDFTAGSASTDLTITGLNLDTDEMYCFVANLCGASAGAATLSVFFNGDTTATNYERALNGATGDNAAIGGLDNGAPGQWIGYVRRCPVTGRVIWTAQGGRIITTAALDYSSTVIWDTAANLTSLTFNSSVASQIAAGSKVRVFKIKSTSTTNPTTVAAVQSSDFVITSNASYADTDVTVALTSGVWLVTLDVMTTQNATPKIDVELSYTGTTTSVAGFYTRWRGGGTAFSEAAITSLPHTMSEITTDSVSRRLSLRLTVSTAGNLKLCAKQNSSSATSVTMHAGTNIQARKIS